MSHRSLVDTKGEPFAYLEGSTLYTLDGEATGRLQGEFIVDVAGTPIWRVIGDGVYSLTGMEPIGYLSQPAPPDI